MISTGLLMALLWGIFPCDAKAWLNEDDIIGAQAEGLAGAFRALAFDNSAIDLNPAGMALYPRIAFDLGYRMATDPKGSRYQLSIIDSLTSNLAAGMAYSLESAQLPESGKITRAQRFLMGFALPVVPKTTFAGFTVRYLRMDYPGDVAVPDLRAVTADFGVLIRPTRMLAVGMSINNIVDADRVELPMNAGGGIGLIVPYEGAPFLMLAADVTVDMGSTDKTQWGWATGGQASVGGGAWLRGGYAKSAATGQEHTAAGFTIAGERWGLDYATQFLRTGKNIRHFLNLSLLAY